MQSALSAHVSASSCLPLTSAPGMSTRGYSSDASETVTSETKSDSGMSISAPQYWLEKPNERDVQPTTAIVPCAAPSERQPVLP